MMEPDSTAARGSESSPVSRGSGADLEESDLRQRDENAPLQPRVPERGNKPILGWGLVALLALIAAAFFYAH